MNAVMTTAEILDALDAMIGVGGLLTGCTLKLYVNDVTPSNNSVLADFTPAAFDGVTTVVSPAWGPAYIDVDAFPKVTAPSHTFISTGTTVQETVYGWVIVKTAGGAYVTAKRFDATKQMGSFAGQGFECEIDFEWPTSVDLPELP